MDIATPPSNRLPLGAWVVLTAVVLIIHFFTAPNELAQADGDAAREEAAALVNTGTLDVSPGTVAAFGGEKGQYFFLNGKTGKWHSKYGIFNTLVYLPVIYLEKLGYGTTLSVDSPRLLFQINVLNTVFTVITAFYLCAAVGLYAKTQWARVVWVLSAIYCTFWWNHTRIQAFEAFTPLLLVASFHHFTLAFRALHPVASGHGRSGTPVLHLSVSALFLGLLILTKVIYLLLPPLFAAFMGWHFWRLQKNATPANSARLNALLLRLIAAFAIPLAAAIAGLLAVNDYKFGHPLNTGYTQWQKETHAMSGNLLAGVRGYTLDPQYSVFVTFPIFAIALFGWREFWRRWTIEALFVAGISAMLVLANARFLNWSGAMSYGPRYLLPVLPLMSLPFVLVLEKIAGGMRRRRVAAWVAATSIAAVLAFSLRWQILKNSVAFYACEYVQWMADGEGRKHIPTDVQVVHYLATAPQPVICGDLLAYKNGKPVWWCDRLVNIVQTNRQERAQSILNLTGPNYYFLH